MNIGVLTRLYHSSYDDFKANFIRFIEKNIGHISKIYDILEELAKNIYKDKLDNGEKGYIYCLYNEVFEHYGKNVYKLGMSNNVKKRLNGYTTSFLDDSKILVQSKELSNRSLAEEILFHLLGQYRIKTNREFFKCELSIRNAFDQIENMFNNKADVIYIDKSIINIKLDLVKIIHENICDLDIEIKINKFIKDDNLNTEDHEIIKVEFNIININDNLINEIRTKTIYDNLVNSFSYFYKNYNDKNNKMYLIDCMVKLFWNDGLFSINTIEVFTGENSLSDKQKLFIKDNENNLRVIFSSIKRKTKPIYSYQLLTWLVSILDEFFGKLISINISRQKHKRIDGIEKYFYRANIDQLKYIELLINKEYNHIKDNYIIFIKCNFDTQDCIYKELHGKTKIKDFHNSS